jgi:FSR family fosmidomycin resistance protein-like MFS transporter
MRSISTAAEITFQYRKIMIISGGHFFHDVFSSFLAVFLPLLISKFSLSMALAGMFTVVFRAPNLMNPLLGILSDRMNLNRLAIWAPAITAVAMSLLGLAPSYGVVCILLLFAGTSASIFHVVGPVMIARIAGTNQGRAMSFWMTGGEAARTLGPILGVWAISQWGFEGSYRVMGIGVVASFFLFFQLKGADPISAKKTQESFFVILFSMRHILLPLMGVMVACSFMMSTLIAYLPTFMVASGKSLWMGGAALAVLEAFGTLGTFTGGTISDRLGRRRTMAYIIPLSAILMMAFVYSPDWIAIPLLALLGLTLFATAPIELAIVQDQSAAHRGTANGIFMGLSFVLMAGVTVSVGWLSDHIGMQRAFAISSFVGLLGTPFVFFLPGQRHAS